MTLFLDHDVCGGVANGDTDAMRAWARIVAMNSDISSREELIHAIEHFEFIAQTVGQGHMDTIDVYWRSEIHEELRSRELEDADHAEYVAGLID